MPVDEGGPRATAALVGRRSVVAALASMASAASTTQAWSALAAPAASAAAGAVPPFMDSLKVFIPSNPGGGWDQTGRALGEAALSSKLVRTVLYENKGGKGGTVGLAEFVSRYRQDSQALLVGGLVMLGALALDRSALSLSAVTPIARLTTTCCSSPRRARPCARWATW